MRVWLAVGMILGTCGVVPGERVPVGIIRGELLEISSESKDFAVRTAASDVYRCRWDIKTYFEREGQRVASAALKAGDRLEIVADEKPGSNYCFARSIRASDSSLPVQNPGYRVNLRSQRLVTDSFAPRGNLTFAGVVLRLNNDRMIVRTRREGEKTVWLRQDTRYMDSGFPSTATQLAVNTRVFIRGGKNFEDQLEAYQVIWGEIQGPR